MEGRLRSKKKAAAPENDYEKAKRLRVEENEKKIEALGLKRISKSFASSVEVDTNDKGKRKAMATTEEDVEYIPSDDSEEDHEPEPEPAPAHPPIPRGRRFKTTARRAPPSKRKVTSTKSITEPEPAPTPASEHDDEQEPATAPANIEKPKGRRVKTMAKRKTSSNKQVSEPDLTDGDTPNADQNPTSSAVTSTQPEADTTTSAEKQKNAQVPTSSTAQPVSNTLHQDATTTQPEVDTPTSAKKQKKTQVPTSSTAQPVSNTLHQDATNTAATTTKLKSVDTTTIPKKTNKSSLLVSKGLSGIPTKIPPASSFEDLKKKRDFKGPRTFDWDTLKNLKVDDQFNEWLTPAWKNFFSIVEPAYDQLVFDFFTTYRYNKHTEDVDSKSMYFKLRGKEFHLSFKEFALAMKLYTIEEVLGEAFQSGITCWPTDASPSDFWNTFGAGPYQKNMSCTSITIPSYKILHRAISESINQRGSCTNHVTMDDLFYMYSIVTNKPCNIAKCLARYLYKSTGKSDSSAVCGGAYITRLALGLGVVTKNDLLKMQVLAKTILFDEVVLKKLEIIEKDPPLRFVEHDNNAGGNGETDTTTHPSVESLATRVTSLEGVLQWQSKALSFMIQKLGFSFDPPPQLLVAGERAYVERTASTSEADVQGTSTPVVVQGNSDPVGKFTRGRNTRAAAVAAAAKASPAKDSPPTAKHAPATAESAPAAQESITSAD